MSNVIHLPIVRQPRVRSECLPETGWNLDRPCRFAQCEFNSSTLAEPRTGAAPKQGVCILDMADNGPMTLQEVGDVLSISREAVRLIEAAALAKLRRRGVRTGALLALREHTFVAGKHAMAVIAEEA